MTDQTPPDYKPMDIDTLREFAERTNDPEALCMLATLYCYGNSDYQDYQKMLECLHKAAKQEYAVAQFNLGLAHYKGWGVPENLTEAVTWWRMAAKQGHAGAQVNLGFHFYAAHLYDEAMEWFHRAAEQGLAVAQVNLGMCHELGHGVPQNYEEAAKWYSMAAAQRVRDAQRRLFKLCGNVADSGDDFAIQSLANVLGITKRRGHRDAAPT